MESFSKRTLRTVADKTASGSSFGLPGNPFLMANYWIAVTYAELGSFEEAEAFAREMSSFSPELKPFEYIYAQTALGFVLMARGRFEAALIASKLALEVADQSDTPFMIPVTASQTGLLLALAGKTQEGISLARRALRTAEQIGIFAGRSRWCARLSEAYFCAGDHTESREQAEAAVRIAEKAQELNYLCSALRLRSKLKIANQELESGRNDVVRASEIARRLCLAPEIAKCHLQLGILEHRSGSILNARREFNLAQRRFRRLGMDTWAEEAAPHQFESD
jgi:tetratricopeptide (TPR) repeat protein